MADLSPTAQAVWDVFDQDEQEIKSVAAVLEALADQLVPPSLEKEFYDRNPSLTLQKAVEIRSKIRAIAAELKQ